MERYLGVDVHRESCTIVVMSEAGKEVQRQVVETNGRALVSFVRQLAGTLHVCLEEGEWSQWLYEVLSPHVADVVVVWPERREPAKSDRLDARELAERLRTGRLGRVVYKAPRRYLRLRELARVYGLLSRDVARSKNRLKSLVRRRGIDCTGEGIYQPEERDRWLKQLPAGLRSIGELLGVGLDCLEELKGEAEEAMVAEAHRYPIARTLETVPGLGPIRVAQMLPIVVTPHRFRTKRQFWSYCGFGIVTRSSADWVKVDGQWVRARLPMTRGLNRNFNRTLKGIFKGAATTVIAHATPGPFRAAYDRLCEQGTKPNLAKVTVARKLAATALAMWKNEEAYDPKR
jgi:transposase